MRALALGVAVALSGAAVLAQSPGKARVPPKSEPTAWACTPKTLFEGEECYFDAEEQPAPGDERARGQQNLKDAAALADEACAAATRTTRTQASDPELVRLCLKDFRDAAGLCDVDGKAPLWDSERRFLPAARACYQGLARVLSSLRVTAAVAPKCCRCLASQKCGLGTEQCYRTLVSDKAREKLGACMRDRCESACAALAPRDTPSDAPVTEP